PWTHRVTTRAPRSGEVLQGSMHLLLMPLPVSGLRAVCPALRGGIVANNGPPGKQQIPGGVRPSVGGEYVQVTAQVDPAVGVIGQQIGLLKSRLGRTDLVGSGEGVLRIVEIGLPQAELQGIPVE